MPHRPAVPALRICVIARAPVPGRTKTRLIPALGADGAAALSAAMTADVLDGVRAAGRPWRVIADGPDHPIFAGCAVEAQADGDLTARLSHALRDGGLALGTDCVVLHADMLRAAFDGIGRDADVCIGRAEDGGYTYVAVTADAVSRGVFEGVPWSTAHTADAQAARAEALGLRVSVVDGGFDIDEPADLARLRRALDGLSPSVAPRTRRWLDLWRD